MTFTTIESVDTEPKRKKDTPTLESLIVDLGEKSLLTDLQNFILFLILPGVSTKEIYQLAVGTM
jgi:hypothetical protein